MFIGYSTLLRLRFGHAVLGGTAFIVHSVGVAPPHSTSVRDEAKGGMGWAPVPKWSSDLEKQCSWPGVAGADDMTAPKGEQRYAKTISS
jgi:hypothetical protein